MKKRKFKFTFLKKTPLWQKITFGSVLSVVIFCLSFWLWTIIARLSPDQSALQALQSTPQIQVQTLPDKTLIFNPLVSPINQGIIFYSGALVEPAAYAPLFRSLSEQGYLVVAPKFNFNLSFTNPDLARNIISSHPEITQWTGIGHSLGGASLSDYAIKNPTALQNIILLATYPRQSNFASFPGKVASITGDEDLILNQKKYKKSRNFLPQAAVLINIPGANHAQFGNYGPQPGDGKATISATAQQAAVLEALQILTGRYTSTASAKNQTNSK